MNPDRRAKVVPIDILHRTNHADVVDLAANVRKQVADFDAAFTVRSELPVGALVEPSLVVTPVMVLGQKGLRVKRINVRNSTGHEHEDDPLGFGRKVRPLGRQWVRHTVIGQQLGKKAG